MSKFQGALVRRLPNLTGVATVCVSVACLSMPLGVSAQSYADESADSVRYSWADVLRVDPVYERVQTRTPHQECEQGDTSYEHADDRAAGTVIGAIVGGVLGNTVGKGDGRRAATVAGAVVGGAVGHGVGSQQDGYAYPERRCHIVDEVSDEPQLIGYDVQYRYRGDVYGSRLQNDPGDRIRVRVSVEPAE